jgi:hypothetical protein
VCKALIDTAARGSHGPAFRALHGIHRTFAPS